MTKPLTMQCSEKWTPAWLRDGLGSGFGDRDGKGTFGPELLFGYTMTTNSAIRCTTTLRA